MQASHFKAQLAPVRIAVANQEIELHDTRVERVERADRSIVLWLSAYMHESDGRPGRDPGTGWSLPARLIIENGELDHPFPSPRLWVTAGQITVGDRLYDNCIPLPFDERGEICLILSGAEGKLAIRGNRAYLEPTGAAVYLEDFSASDEK